MTPEKPDPDAGEQPRRGRPRKPDEEKSEPLTRTVRVYLTTCEQIEKYQQWQIERTGMASERKDIIAYGVEEVVRKKSNEPVSFSLLSGTERTQLQKLSRYLVATDKRDRWRNVIVDLLDVAEDCVNLLRRKK